MFPKNYTKYILFKLEFSLVSLIEGNLLCYSGSCFLYILTSFFTMDDHEVLNHIIQQLSHVNLNFKWDKDGYGGAWRRHIHRTSTKLLPRVVVMVSFMSAKKSISDSSAWFLIECGHGLKFKWHVLLSSSFKTWWHTWFDATSLFWSLVPHQRFPHTQSSPG